MNDLAEDGATAAGGNETLDLEVGDSNTGTEAVLRGTFHLHRQGLTPGLRQTFLQGRKQKAESRNKVRRLKAESRSKASISAFCFLISDFCQNAAMSAEPLFTRRFFGLWLFAFITFFAAFQLLPVIPFRIIDLGGSKAAAGWFLSAYAFASALSAPFMGNLADHLGRKRMLMTAALL
ncbi:MAG: MFS transporter, partial [Thermoanaerobaculia bacterium]